MSSNRKPAVSPACEDRTINLAKKGNTLEDRRTRLLVFKEGEPPQPYMGAQLPPGITNLKCPKKIRVCTALDMKRTCPPPVCDCPPLEPPLTFLGLLKKATIFGCKTAIVGGLIYWTWSIGLWGNQERTHRLYHDMKDMIFTPEEEVNRPHEHAPQVSRAAYKIKNTWNQAVSKTFMYTYIACDKLASFVMPEKTVCETPETQPEKKN